jgi:predicted RNA-binding Zn ribbon-like protein
VAAKQSQCGFQFDLSGGHLALDFANTVSRRDAPEQSTDHITTYHELVCFAQQSHLITSQEADALRRHAQAKPSRAAQVLRQAVALREALFRAFARVAAGKTALTGDLELMEKTHGSALRHRHLAHMKARYVWKWEDGDDPERLLWPIVDSAAALMVSDQLKKIRECEARDCAWLFLDISRNHSRRWCDMKACGNREKARRHYRRQHAP